MSSIYEIIYTPEPEGGFTVIVPALPGCITYGSDMVEAKTNAYEAIDLYIESLENDTAINISPHKH